MIAFKDWLNERYEVDAKARNPILESKALTYLSGRSSLKIVDLGAGTGSNFRYYHRRLPVKKQDWVLVDQDPNLLQEAKKNILKDCEESEVSQRHHGLLISNNGTEIQVDFRQADIFGEELEVDHLLPDLILSNALFDLASADQFNNFCQTIPFEKSVFLTTMNYESTTFSPFDAQDEYFVDQFHQHMSRPQAFGQSMGAGCVAGMSEVLKTMSPGFAVGESVWELSVGETILQKGILGFIEYAIKDLGSADETFTEWYNFRKTQLEGGKAITTVRHQDLLSLPSS